MADSTTEERPEETALSARVGILAEARAAAGSALMAAVLAVLASAALRLAFGLPLLAEVLGDRLTQLIPLPLFSLLLRIFGTNAKHLFAGTLIGLGLLYLAALGALYSGVRRRWLERRTPAATPAMPAVPAVPAATPGSVERAAGTGQTEPNPNALGWLDVPVLVLWVWLPTALLSLLLLGGNFLAALGPQLVLALTFAPSFVLLSQGTRRVPALRADAAMSRRRLLRDVGFAALVVAAGTTIWELLARQLGALFGGTATLPNLSESDVPQRIVPPPTPNYALTTTVPGQTSEVTSAANFYYVSKDLVGDPSVDIASWRLNIHGLVERPTTLTYDQLKALPSVERYQTLECISNEVGGDLMSNGLFRGTSLADILNTAGIKQGATEMIFRAADGYSDELHLAQALDPRALVVYTLDGAPLPVPHGYPARLLVPGLYGMKNGKWLTELELGSGGYNGYWEQQGWTREAVLKMTSRIDTPHDADEVPAGRATTIAGVAFSGAAGISQVQVTTDGGSTWQPAILRQPLGALTWTLWAFTWTPTTADAGAHYVACRAVDLDGNVQQPQTAPTLPDGASGYHIINVLVK